MATCSPDKPMLNQLIISSHEKRTAIKQRASRDREIERDFMSMNSSDAGTGRPWCHASRSNTRGAELPRTSPNLGTTGQQSAQKRSAAQPHSRKALNVCFGCTPAQLAAQENNPHWQCRHHGQDASDADRATRDADPATRLPARSPKGC